MDDIESIILLAKEVGGGSWLFAIIFLWMIRHDVLKPLGKKIERFDKYFDRFVRALEKGGECRYDRSGDLRPRNN